MEVGSGGCCRWEVLVNGLYFLLKKKKRKAFTEINPVPGYVFGSEGE